LIRFQASRRFHRFRSCSVSPLLIRAASDSQRLAMIRRSCESVPSGARAKTATSVGADAYSHCAALPRRALAMRLTRSL
jgi:hypothetical protein